MEKTEKPALAIMIAGKMKEKSEDKGEGSLKELAGLIKKDLEGDDMAKLAKDLKSFIKMCE